MVYHEIMNTLGYVRCRIRRWAEKFGLVFRIHGEVDVEDISFLRQGSLRDFSKTGISKSLWYRRPDKAQSKASFPWMKILSAKVFYQK